MTKSTKIVATIGPATESEEVLRELIIAGMNVARFNTKHNVPEWHHERIRRVRKVARELGKPVGILIDLQGPEIRANLPEGIDSFPVNKGDMVTFAVTAEPGQEKTVLVPDLVIEALEEGKQILIEDGLGEFVVIAKNEHLLEAQAMGSFEVKKRKTINTPGTVIKLPSLIENDLEHLNAAKNDLVDYVGLSFVRDAVDVSILKEELKKRNLHADIIAKIENQSAIDHIDEIIDAADGIMVARGDLAVEVPYQELAHWQKVIIHKCRIAAKPVITATQMLMSMVDSPKPSRAEVTDVANAVYDGTDAVMLSDETTIGKYPVKAVATQASIAEYTEKYAVPHQITTKDFDSGRCITHAAIMLMQTANRKDNDFKIDKIICLTDRGHTAKFISRFRNMRTIHALTYSEETYNKLALVYGVEPHVVNFENEQLSNTDDVISKIMELGIAKSGETVLLLHGSVWKNPGLTNTLRVLVME